MNDHTHSVSIPSSGQTNLKFETEVGSLAVSLRGFGNDKNPTLVLWPSVFSDHHLYDRLAPYLERDYNLILFDPPGQGQSGLSGKKLTLAATARASVAALDQIGIGEVRWIGSSWGGMIGVHAALQSPGRVRHLSLLNTPFDLPAVPAFGTRMIVSGAKWMGNTGIFADGVGRTFFRPETLKADPNFAQHHRNVFLKGNRDMLHHVAHHVLMDRENLSPLLPQLALPVLVLAGRQDTYPAAGMQNAAKLISGAQFQIVENSRHLSAADAPEAVNRLLRSAWADNSVKSEG